MITVEYNKQIEVSKEQYQYFAHVFAGIVAYRKDRGRYWIKWLWPGFRKDIERALNSH